MLKYMIIASVFLFNPLVSNIDALPDTFAYLFIMKALSKNAYIYDHAEEAYNGARTMLIISVAKSFSVLLISPQDPTMSLLLSFSFMLLELIFGIPFFNKLFAHFSKIALNGANGQSANATDKTKTLTIVAFAIRLVLATIPDLTALAINNGVDTQQSMPLVQFRPILFVLTVPISLVLSIIWLVNIIIFFKRLFTTEVVKKCNNDFVQQMKRRKSLFDAKENKNALILISISSILVIDFSWGNFNVALDFAFTFIVAVTLLYLYLKKLFSHKKALICVGVTFLLQGAVNIYESVLSKNYFDRFNFESMYKIPEAEDLYFRLSSVSCVTGALFFVSASLVSFIIVKNGMSNLKKYSFLFVGNDSSHLLNEYKKDSVKLLIYTLICAFLSGVSYSLTVIFKPSAQGLILVNSIFSIIFILSFMKMTSYVNDEVNKRILSHS